MSKFWATLEWQNHNSVPVISNYDYQVQSK